MKLLLTPERLAEIEYDLEKADQAGYPIDWDTHNLIHDWRVLSQEVEVLKRQKAETMKALKDSIANVDTLSQRVAFLEARNAEMQERETSLRERCLHLEDELAAEYSRSDVAAYNQSVTDERIQELEKVLEWYADAGRYRKRWDLRGDDGQHTIEVVDVLEDEGQKAREVLNKK